MIGLPIKPEPIRNFKTDWQFCSTTRNSFMLSVIVFLLSVTRYLLFGKCEVFSFEIWKGFIEMKIFPYWNKFNWKQGKSSKSFNYWNEYILGVLGENPWKNVTVKIWVSNLMRHVHTFLFSETLYEAPKRKLWWYISHWCWKNIWCFCTWST